MVATSRCHADESAAIAQCFVHDANQVLTFRIVVKTVLAALTLWSGKTADERRRRLALIISGRMTFGDVCRVARGSIAICRYRPRWLHVLPQTTDPCIAIGVSWRFVYESA